MAKKSGIHPTTAIVAMLALIAIGAYSLFGNSRKRDIMGTWVADSSTVDYGFQCGAYGIAASINNSTTQYNSWRLSNKKLLLKGKLFKERRVLEIEDTLVIEKLSAKTLIATEKGKTTKYKKIR